MSTQQALKQLKELVLNEPTIVEGCRNMIGRRIDYQLTFEPLNHDKIKEFVIRFINYSMHQDQDQENDKNKDQDQNNYENVLILPTDSENRIRIKELLLQICYKF